MLIKLLNYLRSLIYNPIYWEYESIVNCQAAWNFQEKREHKESIEEAAVLGRQSEKWSLQMSTPRQSNRIAILHL